MTFREFAQLPNAPGKRELLDGELIELPPPKLRHAISQIRIARSSCVIWVDAGSMCAYCRKPTTFRQSVALRQHYRTLTKFARFHTARKRRQP